MGSSRRVSLVRPRVLALGVLLSLVVAAPAARALTISNTRGGVTVPANTAGDPNLVVTAAGTTTFAGRADADTLFVSSDGPIVATAGEISAVQALLLTTGDDVTLSSPLNSIDRATIDTAAANGTLGNIVFAGQQSVSLDVVRGKAVSLRSSGGTITVTTQLRASGALTVTTTAGGIAIAGDTSIGANSALQPRSSASLSGALTVPSVRSGYALAIGGQSADVNVTLNLGALGFVPTAQTRLHVFSWQTAARTVNVVAGTLPPLPAEMSWDLTELPTTGDAVIQVCGDGILAPTEQCDDHNRTPGDGCDSTCHTEPPPQPDGGVDAGPDAGPDGGVDGGDAGDDGGLDGGEDAGPDAGPDAAVDAGKDGGSSGLLDDEEPNPVGVEIEGGACAMGPATGGAVLAPAALVVAAALLRRRRRP